MGAAEILASLRRLCADLDAGRPPRRIGLGRALAPYVLPMAIGLGGCGAAQAPEVEPVPSGPVVVEPAPVEGPIVIEPAPVEPIAVAAYAAPMPPPERCDDGYDNDGDGAIDCADGDCAEACAPPVALYAAPPIGGDDSRPPPVLRYAAPFR